MHVAWLLYVSRNLIDPAEADPETADIVERSRSRNETEGVTGALIATPPHFAQYLEGSAAAVDDLLVRLRKDDRHADIQVIESGMRKTRLFPEWSMAYSGPSLFVGRIISRLAERGSGAKSGAGRLIGVMREFAHPRPQHHHHEL